MKKTFFINSLIILFNLLIATYIYTTYYGFLGGGNVELEKFLIIPIVVVPLFIITFIINLIIKRKTNLSKNELWFPIYSLLAMFLPLLLGDSIDYVMKVNTLPVFMIIGNVFGVILIILSFKMFIKRILNQK